MNGNKSIDKRIIITQNKLFSATKQLLNNKHVDEISIQELCTASGIQRSTFYSHFNNLSEYIDSFINQVIKEVQNDVFKHDEIEEVNYIIYFERLFLSLAHHPEISRIILNKSMGLEFTTKIMSLIRSEVYKGWKKKHINFSENDAIYLFEFLSAGMFGVLNKWISTDRLETPQYISTLLIKMLKEGENIFNMN